MKTSKLSIILVILSLSGILFCKAGNISQPVSIDFGGWCADEAKLTWNELQDFLTTGTIADLIDEQGANTGVSIAVTKRFKAISWTGAGAVSFTGWTMPHYSVHYDSFYGTTVDEETSELTISGLDANQSLDFSFFGSVFATSADQGEQTPVEQNRETSYTVTGATEVSVSLTASNNTSDIAQIMNIKADNDGQIVVTVAKGANNNTTSGSYYLNAMRIAPTVATSINNKDIRQLISVDHYNKKISVTDSSVKEIMIYNTNGTLVSALNGTGTFDLSGLSNGIYIMKVVDDKNNQHTSKLLL